MLKLGKLHLEISTSLLLCSVSFWKQVSCDVYTCTYQGCHRGGAGVLQGFQNGVTGVSQGCRKGVTGVSQGCHMGCRRDVAGMSQGCHRHVTGVSQECHRGVAYYGPTLDALVQTIFFAATTSACIPSHITNRI